MLKAYYRQYLARLADFELIKRDFARREERARLYAYTGRKSYTET
jgi:hypothetical protein